MALFGDSVGVFSVTCVSFSTFTLFCYTCVKSTVCLGQRVYNFYTGLSLTVQTSVPNEFQSVRDFFYGVIVPTEISSFPLSFSFAVFFSLSLFWKLIFPVILFYFFLFGRLKSHHVKKKINRKNKKNVLFDYEQVVTLLASVRRSALNACKWADLWTYDYQNERLQNTRLPNIPLSLSLMRS